MGNKKRADEQQHIYRILVIADAARTAEASELENLEGELTALVTECVNHMATGTGDAGQLPLSSLAIEHARRAIDLRRRQLAGKPTVDS
jgi:hypothetical protein